MIWNNIGWGYRFPKIVRRGGRLIVIKSLKIHISTMPRGKGV
jgi:hypothetical protein